MRHPEMIPMAIITIFYVFVFWKVLVKAGLPGWGAIIPIYNTILMLEMAKKPWWWIFLMLVPIVNFVVVVMVMLKISANFGKGTGFGLGLLFLNPIFFPILAFGSAKYQPVE
jgi:hypothetical protein